MRYIFGPVHSRRLGVSLGIDLVPYKTCSLDCIYCECGKTTHLTCERREWVPTNAVLSELDDLLSRSPRLDAVTFSGSGEPVLHSGIGTIIRHLKEKYPYTVVVLTNGTLMSRDDVRADLLQADIVIPSLDAAGEDAFRQILRPDPAISAREVIEGLVRFRHEFTNRLILEIFIVPGINDTDAELSRIRDAALAINPELVYLNHLDRAGTESWVNDVPGEELERIARYLHPLPVGIVGKAPHANVKSHDDPAGVICGLLQKRDCSIDEIVAATGFRYSEVRKILGGLLHDEVIRTIDTCESVLYSIIPPALLS